MFETYAVLGLALLCTAMLVGVLFGVSMAIAAKRGDKREGREE